MPRAPRALRPALSVALAADDVSSSRAAPRAKHRARSQRQLSFLFHTPYISMPLLGGSRLKYFQRLCVKPRMVCLSYADIVSKRLNISLNLYQKQVALLSQTGRAAMLHVCL